MPDSHLEADYEDRNGAVQDDYLDDWDDPQTVEWDDAEEGIEDEQ